jgi:hypothetical protein
VSTPWHRQLYKVFSHSRIIYLVKPQSRFRPNYFPDSSTSSLLVHRLPHPLIRQKHQPQLQCLHFPSLNATFHFRPWKVTFRMPSPCPYPRRHYISPLSIVHTQCRSSSPSSPASNSSNAFSLSSPTTVHRLPTCWLFDRFPFYSLFASSSPVSTIYHHSLSLMRSVNHILRLLLHPILPTFRHFHLLQLFIGRRQVRRSTNQRPFLILPLSHLTSMSSLHLIKAPCPLSLPLFHPQSIRLPIRSSHYFPFTSSFYSPWQTHSKSPTFCLLLPDQLYLPSPFFQQSILLSFLPILLDPQSDPASAPSSQTAFLSPAQICSTNKMDLFIFHKIPCNTIYLQYSLTL